MIVVIATLHASAGKEDHLRDVLTAITVESRLEPGCLQYDLLVSEEDPAEFAIYERWESEAALNAHLRSKHITVAHAVSREAADRLPTVVSYRGIEPNRRAHTGETRRLSDDESEGPSTE